MKKFLTAFALTMMLSTTANAGTIETVGQGVDQPSAVRAALRQAIEIEVGTIVDSRTRIENRQLIDEEITLHSSGYVEGYEILSVTQRNGIVEVTVRADVRSEQLRAELMSKLEKKSLVELAMNDPRIKIIAVDQHNRELIDVENKFIAALKAQGFSRMISSVDDADYVADILVDDNSIAARLVATANGEIVCAETFDIQRRLFTDTRGRAINNAARLLARAALEHAAQLEQHITVSIVSSIAPDRLIERLNSISGVSGVFRRSLTEFDVNFDGNSGALADALEREGFTIRELSATSIKI